jgi:hypothetical protein
MVVDTCDVELLRCSESGWGGLPLRVQDMLVQVTVIRNRIGEESGRRVIHGNDAHTYMLLFPWKHQSVINDPFRALSRIIRE